MSAAEIADNRWELSATKTPIATLGGLSSLIMMTGFAIFFGWIIAFSVMGIVMPKNEDAGWAGEFKNLKAGGSAEGEAAPAQ
jgi:hypothetical protein